MTLLGDLGQVPQLFRGTVCLMGATPATQCCRRHEMRRWILREFQVRQELKELGGSVGVRRYLSALHIVASP